ncbi:MobF family relaxase [Nocardioides sp. NPDC051685]|uniref:MobF family relaxase n=1 Tax=Nocardioides sp. NPDC051685 TaxID=3364334 RepID=UPI00379AA49E
MKFYKASAANARRYVEADRSAADDYYLGEGSGLVVRYRVHGKMVGSARAMDGPTYERWVAGYDVETGKAKGRLRTDAHGVKFLEVAVNGPKTWSLAAAVHPEVSVAYDGAQERAVKQILAWVGEHATTRVGPRGRQVHVPVEGMEAAVIRHYTSRAGDPHRHLHLQFNTRVRALGRWRGLHTVGLRDSIEAINGIGHAAVQADLGFRSVLASLAYHLDPESGEIVELEPYVGAFSARSKQIEQNMDRYEASWRADHPGEEPGPALRRAWDRRAWADARPDKVMPTSGAELEQHWREQLAELGFKPPRRSAKLRPQRIGRLDRDRLVADAVSLLGARRSAWNAADARGEVERLVTATDVVAEASVRQELAEDLTARVVAASVPLLGRDDVPEHVRALTSPRVLAVEYDLVDRLARRADAGGKPAASRRVPASFARLDPEQAVAAAQVAGSGALLVVEGAAGAGKTATLAAANALVRAQGSRMMVVTPTRKAAQVASAQIDASAAPVAWLLHQHGYRWDAKGRWGRIHTEPAASARLAAGDLLVVDEAGMLDQDSADALLALADDTGARVALVGDRHQLPAVGRGGVLDLACRYAPSSHLAMDGVRRFTDPRYARLTLQMRRGEAPGEVFDELAGRGEIVVHASEVERLAALAGIAQCGDAVVADTREQVAKINGLVHDLRRITGEVSDGVVTAGGERIGIGDVVATRHNDSTTGVANRETWTVTSVDRRGLQVSGPPGRRRLPREYVAEHVELAYATTVHGIQGVTVSTAHVLVGHHTSGSSAYVGMTRGRDHNIAHLVAEDLDEARQQWIEVFGRDRADLGPAHAAQRAAEDIERYGSRAMARYVRTPVRDPRTSRSPGPRQGVWPDDRRTTSQPSGPAIGM